MKFTAGAKRKAPASHTGSQITEKQQDLSQAHNDAAKERVPREGETPADYVLRISGADRIKNMSEEEYADFRFNVLRIFEEGIVTYYAANPHLLHSDEIPERAVLSFAKKLDDNEKDEAEVRRKRRG